MGLLSCGRARHAQGGAAQRSWPGDRRDAGQDKTDKKEQDNVRICGDWPLANLEKNCGFWWAL